MPCRLPISHVLLAGVVLGALFLAGCGSSRTVVQEDSPAVEAPSPSDSVEQRLRRAAADWRETPHTWGGTSKTGADCSGLVQAVFQNTLQRSLPRTTRRQSQVGTEIPRSALAPGDLVFFRVDSPKGRHVGIHLSEGDFLHASASRGVMVSNLHDPYWSERWWQARRVLSTASQTGTSDPVPSAPAEALGW